MDFSPAFATGPPSSLHKPSVAGRIGNWRARADEGFLMLPIPEEAELVEMSAEAGASRAAWRAQALLGIILGEKDSASFKEAETKGGRAAAGGAGIEWGAGDKGEVAEAEAEAEAAAEAAATAALRHAMAGATKDASTRVLSDSAGYNDTSKPGVAACGGDGGGGGGGAGNSSVSRWRAIAAAMLGKRAAEQPPPAIPAYDARAAMENTLKAEHDYARSPNTFEAAQGAAHADSHQPRGGGGWWSAWFGDNGRGSAEHGRHYGRMAQQSQAELHTKPDAAAAVAHQSVYATKPRELELSNPPSPFSVSPPSSGACSPPTSASSSSSSASSPESSASAQEGAPPEPCYLHEDGRAGGSGAEGGGSSEGIGEGEAGERSRPDAEAPVLITGCALLWLCLPEAWSATARAAVAGCASALVAAQLVGNVVVAAFARAAVLREFLRRKMKAAGKAQGVAVGGRRGAGRAEDGEAAEVAGRKEAVAACGVACALDVEQLLAEQGEGGNDGGDKQMMKGFHSRPLLVGGRGEVAEEAEEEEGRVMAVDFVVTDVVSRVSVVVRAQHAAESSALEMVRLPSARRRARGEPSRPLTAVREGDVVTAIGSAERDPYTGTLQVVPLVYPRNISTFALLFGSSSLSLPPLSSPTPPPFYTSPSPHSPSHLALDWSAQLAPVVEPPCYPMLLLLPYRSPSQQRSDTALSPPPPPAPPPLTLLQAQAARTRRPRAPAAPRGACARPSRAPTTAPRPPESLPACFSPLRASSPARNPSPPLLSPLSSLPPPPPPALAPSPPPLPSPPPSFPPASLPLPISSSPVNPLSPPRGSPPKAPAAARRQRCEARAQHGGGGGRQSRIIKDIEARCAEAAGVPAAVRERVSVMPLDLASLKSVSAFAADYLRLNRPLHLLINNAGVMICPFMLTADGYENQFGTNHVGHFLLTNLLLPKLKETAKQEGAEARIVIVSSAAHQFPYPGGIRFDAINAKEGYDSVKAYGQSKLANILHAWELARRLKQEEGAGVTVNALHPGVIDTNLSRHIVPPGTIWHTLGRGAYSLVFQWFMKTIPQGAATSCFLAAHPSVAGASGGYYADSRAAEGKATALSKDMELAGKLWELSEQMASKE
ncbi:unnamed protein product [Closterium sp. Naga37s-1]|nr:unnamed protein product [Closterium sp. Naga37s-1]